EAAGKLVFVLPVPLQEFCVRSLDLKRMRRRPEADHRPAPSQIVGDVLHLPVGEILESEKHDQEIRRLERVESGDVRAPWLNEPGLRIGREEDTALEPVVLRKNPRERRKRFLRSIFMIAAEEDDVFAVAWTLVALIDDEGWILRRCRSDEQPNERE